MQRSGSCLIFLYTFPAWNFAATGRFQREVSQKLRLALKGLALAVADALDQAHQCFAPFTGAAIDVNDITFHRYTPSRALRLIPRA